METNERPLEKYPGKWRMTLFAIDEFINNDFTTLKVRKGEYMLSSLDSALYQSMRKLIPRILGKS